MAFLALTFQRTGQVGVDKARGALLGCHASLDSGFGLTLCLDETSEAVLDFGVVLGESRVDPVLAYLGTRI